jgi:hypothetical protein
LDLSFKCVNDGIITFGFKGLDYRDKKGYRIPIYIDYTEIIIDDESLVSGSKVCWHDNPFNYNKKVKNGQIIKIQVKWRPVNPNSIFNIVSDPEKNVYELDSVKKIQEILRMVRIFNIVREQRVTSKPIAARGLVAFKMLVSNN